MVEGVVEQESKHPLLILLGPTGSGKTALSLELAHRFRGEIVSCDSVAIYRGFEIGAAKPTARERGDVPHHLLDIASPDDVFTAGDYSRIAREAIGGISARGRLPIVVGGSGLYLRALLDGLFPGPRRSERLRERLRARASRRGSTYVHRILRRLDPASAARIHQNDLPKTIRAIEVCLIRKQPMLEAWSAGRNPLRGYRILRLGLDPDRSELYTRINARAHQMFAGGLIEETAALLACYGTRQTEGKLSGKSTGPLGSLGYREAAEVLEGSLSIETAMVAVARGHRNYAKRQMTWFRREPNVVWLRGFGDQPAIQAKAADRMQSFLDCADQDCPETDSVSDRRVAK